MPRKATEEEKRLAREVATAICTKCFAGLPRANFQRDEKKTNGLLSICRACIAKAHKKHYDENRIAICERKRLKEAAHPEKTRLDRARWRTENKDQRRIRNKEWYAKNKVAAKTALRAWAAANPERAKAAASLSHKRWRQANPERYYEAAMRAYHKRRALKHHADYEPLDINDIIRRDGPHCYICGRLTQLEVAAFFPNKAELEHVLPLSKGGTHTSQNLRCACWTCNRSKGSRFTAEETRTRIFSTRPGRRLIESLSRNTPSRGD